MPLNVAQTLLIACDRCYDIAATGAVPGPFPPHPVEICYTEAPYGFAGGPDGRDAAMIAQTADAIIVAFRGTMPPTSADHLKALLDWANDADEPLVPNIGVQDPPQPGMVHQGFLDSLNNLWGSLKPAIQTRLQLYPNKPLWITGHSKGGPLALLAAMRCQTLWPAPGLLDRPVEVVTFAGARAGDAAFAAKLESYVERDGTAPFVVTRYENTDDIVPHLPPDAALAAVLGNVPFIGAKLAALARPEYVSAGTLEFIDWDGAIIGENPALDAERTARLQTIFDKWQFSAFAGDHPLDGVPGYATRILGP